MDIPGLGMKVLDLGLSAPGDIRSVKQGAIVSSFRVQEDGSLETLGAGAFIRSGAFITGAVNTFVLATGGVAALADLVTGGEYLSPVWGACLGPFFGCCLLMVAVN